MTARLRFVVCLHEAGGLESGAKNSTSRFSTICIYFLGKDSAKYTTSLLKAGLIVSMQFSAFFNLV